MEFFDVVAARKSIRDYQQKPVEPEKLNRILEAARQAPSWGNKQACRYIIVTDKKKIDEIGGTLLGFIKQAPILVIACADPKASGSHNNMDYYLVDVGIALQQLVLAATNEGLGTCWIGGHDEAKIKQLLSIPQNIKVVAITPIGYPAGASLKSKFIISAVGADKRKPIDAIVHKEQW